MTKWNCGRWLLHAMRTSGFHRKKHNNTSKCLFSQSAACHPATPALWLCKARIAEICWSKFVFWNPKPCSFFECASYASGCPSWDKRGMRRLGLGTSHIKICASGISSLLLLFGHQLHFSTSDQRETQHPNWSMNRLNLCEISANPNGWIKKQQEN